MILYRYLLKWLLLTDLLAASPLEYINHIRAKSALAPLKYSKVLSKAALKHAKYVFQNRALGHFESSLKPYFFARAPWERIVKAGFKTAVVVENISFYEPSFKASIEKLMATVYHRLAFLSPRVDTIGYGKWGNIYVYDMSNSKIAMLCAKDYNYSGSVVENVCYKKSSTIPQNLFYSAIDRVKSKSKKIVVYPYRNQTNVPLSGVQEQPLLLSKGFGYPVTVTFNNRDHFKVLLKSFKLYRSNQSVASKIFTALNDRNKKIKGNTFVLVPKRHLSPKTKYHVRVTARVNRELKTLDWGFTTR